MPRMSSYLITNPMTTLTDDDMILAVNDPLGADPEVQGITGANLRSSLYEAVKVTQLPTLSELSGTDGIYIIDDADGEPLSCIISVASLLSLLNSPITVTALDTYLLTLSSGGGTANGMLLEQTGLGKETISIHVLDGGGDAQIGFIVDDAEGISIGTEWHIGLDNSADDDFVISAGTALESSPRLYFDRSTGGVGFGAAPPTTGNLAAGLYGVFATSGWSKCCLTDSAADHALKTWSYCINNYHSENNYVLGMMLNSYSTNNTLFFGGGSSIYSCVDRIYFYTGAYPNTSPGSIVAKMDLTGMTIMQGDPATIADGNTPISSTNLQARILTMTSSTAPRAPTVPSGSDVHGIIEIGQALDWLFLNEGDQTVTITQATGHTLRGTMTIAAGSQGMFRTRCSADDTGITYRIG